MAEFSEVMKQLARMTNACNGKCDKCPLDDSMICTGPWCSGNMEGIAKAERIVMQWAAEHPEPVYPTWGEWFAERGELIDNWTDIKVSKPCPGVIWVFYTPIPADIAEKLGIEPKEASE